MITNLRVSNYALIDKLDINFNSGFSVITGETGAGKSIILGALSLLLGSRADTKAVKNGTAKCVVEGHFDITGLDLQTLFDELDIEYDAADTILRREVTAAGKSRAFVNDTPVSLAILRQVAEQLVDIHSQHQNLMLRDSDFQLSVIDTMAGNEKELAAYHEAYKAYTTAVSRLETLQRQIDDSTAQEDYMRFQYQELADAHLDDPDEQETLEQQSRLMTNAEDIKAALYKANGTLYNDDCGVISLLKQAVSALESVADDYADAQPLAERLNACYIEAKDVSAELSYATDRIDYDPQELIRINERLDTIYSLQRKHHCDDIATLIAIREELDQKLCTIDNSSEELAACERQVAETRKKAETLAARLTTLRTRSAKKVDAEMVSRLVALGMPKIQFCTQFTETDLSKSGRDHITFLFSANSSSQPQPVAQIASGGEIARVMLSLKAMTGNATSLPTIIFDEIDTGVSGKVAEAMAHIMTQMSQNGRQVLSITHLPQIASAGSTHYRVQKTDTGTETHTQMTMLTHDERINEIAQMLSGSNISEAALQQAAELLSQTQH